MKIELGSDVVGLLNGLVGTPIQLVRLGDAVLTYGAPYFESANIFLRLNNGSYLCITTSWFETEISAYDFFNFEATVLRDLKIENMRNYFSFVDTAPISSIEVYRKEVNLEDETVIFDHTLVIHREDGKGICFCGGESAFRKLFIYSEETAINCAVEGLKLRKTLAK